MYLVWIGVALIALKAAGIGFLAELSWWWVLAPLALAFVWFEWIERALGLDRRAREHKQVDEAQRLRKERLLRELGRAPKRSAR